MSYQGGHDGYSVDWQSHDHQYASPNQNPRQVMTNSSSQPAAYYSPRPPSVSQPQIAQPWLGNGNNNHPQYAPQNGYPFNQAYPTMPMAQPQQFQPQYSQPLPPQQQQQQQQQRMPQPQSHKRPQQNPPYSEQQYKRVQHQSPHMNQPIVRSPQTSYGQQPHQHAPQRYHHIEQTSQQVPMNPSYTEQRLKPLHQSYSADPSQRTPHPHPQSQPRPHPHPHTSRSTISPSDVVLQPRQQPTKPSALSSQSPNQRTMSPSHLTPQPLDRRTISPSNLGTNSGISKPPTISPSNLGTNSGTSKPPTISPSNLGANSGTSKPPTISPSNLGTNSGSSKPPTIIPSNTISRFPEARTISPSNLLSQPAEQHTIKPSNLMSPHNESLTISPSNLLSRPAEQYTASPSNVMSPHVEPRTISPSSLISQPPEQPTVIPPNLLTKAAPVPSHRSQIDQPLLLIALAEEYFEAAHSLAPSVALAMDENSVEHYNKLIATGLGCLEAAMKKAKLPPRLEANVTLRFAGVLYDEDTDNFMDAELILSKGIATCDRNHYYDLKYAMQFLLAQFMFKKNYKAAMKALDSYIADAEAYQHYSWIYALRFLRATHALNSGNIAESHACLQNLRSISNIASKQDDHAIFQMASLMEAITHLRSSGPESIENVQRAIAAASTYQLDEDNKLPQLIGLTHILDVACSIRRGNPADMRKKLQAMQLMMDDALSDPRWSKTSDTISIPINRPRKESHTVSRDTRTILGIGDDGRDNLIVSFLNMRDAYAITYLLCGLILLHDLSDRKASTSEGKASTTHKAEMERKGFKYLREGLSKLSTDTRSVKNSSGLLPNLVQKLNWRGQILCYFHLYMAFGMAAIANWSGVKKSIDEARLTAENMQVSLEGPLGFLIPYLEGVYHQGSGDLDTALEIFQNEKFTLSPMKCSNPSSVDQLEHDITILAALNALSILREGTRQDITVNTALIQRLEPLCIKHPNVDIQTAFHISAATLKTSPPAPGFQARNHLRESMHGAQRQANKQFVCITLNMMCSTFFQNIVGEQAEKSAKAAVVHAREGGNPLWISVADGLISHFYDIQGNKREAQAAFEEGRVMAERAVPNS